MPNPAMNEIASMKLQHHLAAANHLTPAAVEVSII
jgi:hypothetical protein